MTHEKIANGNGIEDAGSLRSARGVILDTTLRFSDRVEQYVRYRPGYPQEVIDLLAHGCGLGPAATAADIGSGTGIFTALLLPVCGIVYAVEPNDPMRAASDDVLSHFDNYHSVKGTSEATGLADSSIDCITVAQAFHWFDREKTLPEFRRIAKPGCRLAIIFNQRQNDTPFLEAYEAALKSFAGDYNEVTQKNIPPEAYVPFFAGPFTTTRFNNGQIFDRAGVLGRLSSSSYCPKPDDPRYLPLCEAVIAAFDRCNVDGKVAFSCPTTIYQGTLA